MPVDPDLCSRRLTRCLKPAQAVKPTHTKSPRLPLSIILAICQTFFFCKRMRTDALLWAVHILRQPPKGGEGVSQMLTIADEGGRGGTPNPYKGEGGIAREKIYKMG